LVRTYPVITLTTTVAVIAKQLITVLRKATATKLSIELCPGPPYNLSFRCTVAVDVIDRQELLG